MGWGGAREDGDHDGDTVTEIFYFGSCEMTCK